MRGKNILMSTIFKKKYSHLEIVKKEYNLLEFKEGVTKHIYEHEIMDIISMWNTQLKSIQDILP